MPAAPIAMPVVPSRQGRPKLSLMTTPIFRVGAVVKRLPHSIAAVVGIARQQQYIFLALRRGHVGGVDPAFAIIQPLRCSVINTPGAWRMMRRLSESTTSTSLGILVGSLCNLDCPTAGYDRAKVHQATFRLGNNFLRQDENISVLKAQARFPPTRP